MSEIKGEKFIHFHIPKTAGTSVRASFVRHYGAEAVGFLRPDDQLVRASDLPFKVEQADKGRRLTRNLRILYIYTKGISLINRISADAAFDLSSMERVGIDVAVGHFTPGHITEPIAHIPRTTILRDPLSRTWSHYAHWRDSRGTTWWHEGSLPYSEGVSFEDFALDPSLANYQSGRMGNLGFNVIGVSSNIPGFFEEIGLGRDAYLPVLNPGRYKETPPMDPGFVRDFEEANRADYELFAAAGGQ